MQQTRTQSLVSRKMKRARECGARRGRAEDYGSPLLDPQFLALSLLFLSKRLGESLGVPWAWDRAEKGEKAHRFGQLYEINVSPPSKRPPLEFPFSSCTSLEFPAVKQTPSP